MIYNILSIAGSDPSGGAGVQADIKACSACGAYAMAAITALTAQNTRGVAGVHLVPPEFVRRQIDAVFDDIRVDAVKVGMVATAGIAAAIADALLAHRPAFIVVDPVMVAKSGDRLLDTEAEDAVRTRLVPLADVLTPNLLEAAALLGKEPPQSPEAQQDAAIALRSMGARAVLLKGGFQHAERAGSASDDLLADESGLRWFNATRIQTDRVHGSGCTLSAAIAALRPSHPDLPSTIAAAKAFVHGAIERAPALNVGKGRPPTHHFHRLWA
ncbi:MAG: bifunctional hydroxymethylpyrimidine kinase/phosphomethylpyrimidine kinase [Phycisphaerales bacterium]|nr:MAG: bifunctional hydroxymethylpyrimidine kinase/phosphomethylpyrimidine kinase [Phycisphaerales bacterium]